jgi:hypothetical protein
MEIKVAPYHNKTGYSFLSKDLNRWKAIEEYKKHYDPDHPYLQFRPCSVLAGEPTELIEWNLFKHTADTTNSTITIPFMCFSKPQGTWAQLCYPPRSTHFLPSVHQVHDAIRVISWQTQWLMGLELYAIDLCLEDLLYFNDQTYQPYLRDPGALMSGSELRVESRKWPSLFAQKAGVLFPTETHRRTENISLAVLYAVACTAMLMLKPDMKYEQILKTRGTLRAVSPPKSGPFRQMIAEFKQLPTHDKDSETALNKRVELYRIVISFLQILVMYAKRKDLNQTINIGQESATLVTLWNHWNNIWTASTIPLHKTSSTSSSSSASS